MAATAPVELARTELPFPDSVYNLVLSGAAVTVTKPAGVSWMLLTVSADCWMRTGGTAAVPAANLIDGTGSVLIKASDEPKLWRVLSVSTFSIIDAAGATVAISWFRDHSDR